MIIKTKKKDKLFYVKFKKNAPDFIYTECITLLPAVLYVFKNLKEYFKNTNFHFTDKYYYHNF